MSNHSGVIVAVAASAVLGACASGPPPATDAIERAQVALERAQSVGASQSAAEDLNEARNKLDQARDANRARRKQPPTALQLAQQAEIDAEVAEARTRALQAQSAADELRRSLDALQQEAQQNQQQQDQDQGQGPPASAPPAAGPAPTGPLPTPPSSPAPEPASPPAQSPQ